jgi:branched-chain amino acid transport system permease protein
MGAVFGVIVGLPALRLRTFYFAMTTLGFATIVTQVALAWKDITGGGVGTPGPVFPWPFDPGWGFYYFCFLLAALATWMTANIGSSRYGRALVAIRDADVAAEACGISKPALLIMSSCWRARWVASRAACSPRCSPTSRPTPSPSRCRCCSSSASDRRARLDPGAALGTADPDRCCRSSRRRCPVVDLPLRRASAGDRAGDPGGIADLLDYKNRRPLEQHREIVPRPRAARTRARPKSVRIRIRCQGHSLHFGG